MHVFYTPDIASNLELPEEEAGHCLRVLRLSIGDEIMLTDGKGCFYKAVISAASGKRCQVKVTETIPQEKGWNGWLHIAMAPTKNMDRTEWFTERGRRCPTGCPPRGRSTTTTSPCRKSSAASSPSSRAGGYWAP